MTAPDLASFLLDRVADREREAPDIHRHDCDCFFVDAHGGDYLPEDCDCGEPARILAECAALRAVVELHRPEERVTGYRGNEPIREWQCPSCGGAGVDFDPGGNRFVDRWNDRAPCDTLLALARVHADHPDFRPEWRAG